MKLDEIPYGTLGGELTRLRTALADREAKLKKAREALRQIAGVTPWDDTEAGYIDKARTTLKDIT